MSSTLAVRLVQSAPHLCFEKPLGPRFVLACILITLATILRLYLWPRWNLFLTLAVVGHLGTLGAFALHEGWGIALPFGGILLPLALGCTAAGLTVLLRVHHGLDGEYAFVVAVVLTLGWALLLYYMTILAAGEWGE